MIQRTIARREALTAAAGGVLANVATAGTASAGVVDFNDPLERTRIRVRLIASAAEETVYTFYRLHFYAYLGRDHLLPLYTMNNLNVRVCKPLDDGTFHLRTFEAGTYCNFDTDTVMDTWTNPVTGETRDVWHFYGGPFEVKIGADELDTGEDAGLRPEPLRMDTIGDMLFMPTVSAFSYPSLFDPEEWPTESPGKDHHWDSMFVYSARMEDVNNPDIANLRAFIQFQNMGSWNPWVGMGGVEGRTYGRAYGTKLASLSQLDPTIRRGLEVKTPEIFDLDNWQSFRNNYKDYIEAYGS